MASVDHRSNLATRRLGTVPGFEWYGWECLNDPPGSVLLSGAVVLGTVASGKSKGRKRYGKELHAVVTDEDMLTERRRYERETGNCAECGGDGQACRGWDHIKGTLWHKCPLCDGSGKPRTVAAVDPQDGTTPA